MSGTEKTISSLISSQLPDFVKANHPQFQRFIELYYQWLEQNNPAGSSNTAGNTVYQAAQIANYRDIDSTPDEFVRYFKEELLPYFPENTALDIKKILKSAREFYSQKGSEESIKWLFKALFDEDIEINYPKEQILIASDGKWKLPRAFRITVGETNKNIDVNLLERRLAVGNSSGATCTIESANRTIDPTNGIEVIEIYISNIKQFFENGEFITVNYLDENGVEKTFSEKIIGTISNIRLDSNRNNDPNQRRRGLLYNVGDPVVITGGLATTAEANDGVAIVGNVSFGSIESVITTFPGYGYRVYSNTSVIALRSTGDNPNANANTDLRVTALNTSACTANSQLDFFKRVTYDKSAISYVANTTIGNASFDVLTDANKNIVLNVEEIDFTDNFINFAYVWANGNNYTDALFTGTIITPNGNTLIDGTVSVTAGAPTEVVGLGTYFESTFIDSANLQIEISGERRNITSITNNNHLVVSSGFVGVPYANEQANRIGAFGAGVADANSLLVISNVANTGDLSIVLNGAQLNVLNTTAETLVPGEVYNNDKSFINVSIVDASVDTNANSIIFQCLRYETINTGGVALIVVEDGGFGFRSAPDLQVTSHYNTLLTENLNFENPAERVIIESERQSLKDLGLVAHVYIDNGGTNYQAGEIITFSGRGYGGQAYIDSVNASGSITSVIVSDRGEGYLERPTCVISTANGTGAALTAFLIGDGVENTVGTNAIGRIRDLRLIYRGFDYVATPNISLKVVDTIINPVSESFDFIEGEYVYQGSSFATSTFRANVKQYVRSTGLLRLYNYSGFINPTIDFVSQNGVFANVNTSAKVPAPAEYDPAVIATGLPNPMYYGDGRARANVLFANGLIEFNGFYINTDGFPSSDKRLQDGRLYQNFSYIIQSEKPLVSFESPVKNIVHPSGMLLVSKTIVPSNLEPKFAATANVDLIKPKNYESNVATITIADSTSNVVTGSQTNFLNANTRVNVGDLLIIDSNTSPPSPLRSVSKIVSVVTSDTQLEVFGDFVYAGQGKITLTSGNTSALINGNTNAVSEFLIAGDEIKVNVSNVTITGTVNVSGTTVAGNSSGSNTTYFLGNVIVGSEITVNGETRLVTIVTDANTLTVNSAFTNAAEDKYLIANSLLTKEVVSISGNVLSLNTAIYNANLTNSVYLVIPDYSSVNYSFNVITLSY